MVSAAPPLRCRQIEESDIEAIAALLVRGFPTRNRQFWLRAFVQLRRHATPPSLPKYCYLLESDGRAVGAVLLICSLVRADGKDAVRCNLSSWYVDPAFRAYAPMLVSQALRHKDVTYVNVSPARHTWPIIEAQGFSRYCDGIFVAVPIVNGLFGGPKATVFDVNRKPQVSFDPRDQEMLLQHAALGCVSFWCVTAERAYPFVFRRRFVRGVVPCAQLIYCSDLADFVRFAGPIGWFLARRGLPFVLIDADAPMPGLTGWYSNGNMPKYFKRPQRPRLGDLAFTEHAVIGV
jgi:hypothetical protein